MNQHPVLSTAPGAGTARLHGAARRARRRLAVVLVALSLLAGACAHATYRKTPAGTLEGDLDVRWIKPDRFVYVPSTTNPLTFTTATRRVIVPRKMYTDGGSIPRLFWNVPGYSPWGYAPGYIVHDWLFVAHHCKFPDYQDVTFEESAAVLASAIKTLMVKKTAPTDETTLWAVYRAVKSPIARKLWDEGTCDLPPPPPPGEEDFKVEGELLLRIRIPREPPH